MSGQNPFKINLSGISASGTISMSNGQSTRALLKRIAKNRAAKAKEEKPAPICPLCNEDVDTDYHSAERKPAYMDGWHHWDCLDKYLGVVRDENGNKIADCLGPIEQDPNGE
jgi:hypothetical protein